ncbi:type III secretion system effector protein [Chitinophaga agri]|uniref:Uncharacterized protein n=1 Tax=Chitinophaga agri TaxID=2703787 RepID=A0A6B9Z9T4_9BACT|nr:hypothetical protein [Chitinophaga agri]QHS58321.1 hypothetical protein GWR21_01545 [Chitinophaga agri]
MVLLNTGVVELTSNVGKDDEVEFTGEVPVNANGNPIGIRASTEIVTDLIKHDGTDVFITESDDVDKNDPVNFTDGSTPGKGSGSSIRYNPYIRNDVSDKTTSIVNVDVSFGFSPFVLLGHELFHALELKYGKK